MFLIDKLEEWKKTTYREWFDNHDIPDTIRRRLKEVFVYGDVLHDVNGITLYDKPMTGSSVTGFGDLIYEGALKEISFSKIFESCMDSDDFSPAMYVLKIVENWNDDDNEECYGKNLRGVIARGLVAFPSLVREVDLTNKLNCVSGMISERAKSDEDMIGHTDINLKYKGKSYRLWSYKMNDTNTVNVGKDNKAEINTLSKLIGNRGDLPKGLHILFPINIYDPEQAENHYGWMLYKKEYVTRITGILDKQDILDYYKNKSRLVDLMKKPQIINVDKETYYKFNDRDLDEYQIPVVDDVVSRIITVSAGPGSGKTTAIVNKIVKMVLENEYKPEDIVLLTFTNKAIDELRLRVFKKLGRRAFGIVFRTFHSYAAAISGEEPSIDPNIFDRAITNLENKTNLVEKFYKKKVLFLDEAQDLNGSMFSLVQSLVKANFISDSEYLKVIAVFDVDQSIYEYSGITENEKPDTAYARKLRNLCVNGDIDDCKKTDTHYYEFLSNYRSRKEIVEYTEVFREKYYNEYKIPMTREKEMKSGLSGSEMGIISFCKSPDKNSCCDVLIDKIYEDIKKSSENDTFSVGVLVYKNSDVSYIYDQLKELLSGLEFVHIIKTGRGGSYDGKDGNYFSIDQLDEFDAILRRLRNIQRIKMLNGIIPIKIVEEQLDDFAKAYSSSTYKDDAIKLIRDYIYTQQNLFGYRSIILDYLIYHLKSISFDEFLDDYSGFAEIGLHDNGIEIIVSTIHKCKGMEFDKVYLSRPVGKDGITKAIIKERFVGMTRAKKELTIIDYQNQECYANLDGVDEYVLKNKPEIEGFTEHLDESRPTPKDVVISFVPRYQDGNAWYPYSEILYRQESDINDTEPYIQAGSHLEVVRSEGSSLFCADRRNVTVYLARLSGKGRTKFGDCESGEVLAIKVSKLRKTNIRKFDIKCPVGIIEAFDNQYDDEYWSKLIIPVVYSDTIDDE